MQLGTVFQMVNVMRTVLQRKLSLIYLWDLRMGSMLEVRVDCQDYGLIAAIKNSLL